MNRVGIFLDRDGTIIEESDYLRHPSQIKFLDGSIDAIKSLNQSGLKTFIVSNQSAVARGILSEEDLAAIHDAILREIEKGGGKIDALYYCPHHPEFGAGKYRIDCGCRKPKTGMLEKAAAEHGVSLRESFVVGDKMTDVQTGVNCGARTILVMTGYGKEELEACRANKISIDFVAADLSEAASFIRNRITQKQSSNVRTKIS